ARRAAEGFPVTEHADDDEGNRREEAPQASQESAAAGEQEVNQGGTARVTGSRLRFMRGAIRHPAQDFLTPALRQMCDHRWVTFIFRSAQLCSAPLACQNSSSF